MLPTNRPAAHKIGSGSYGQPAVAPEPLSPLTYDRLLPAKTHAHAQLVATCNQNREKAGEASGSQYHMALHEASLPAAEATYRIPIDPSHMTPQVAAGKAQAEAVPCPTAHRDADRHAIADMHAQLVTMRYQGLDLKHKFTMQQAIHDRELAQLHSQLHMQREQHVHAAQGMRAHAMVQETRIKELTADKVQWEQQRKQRRTDVCAFKEVIKEKDKKIWKYTQQLGDKAADLEMVRANRDAARELVKELKNKVNVLERAKEVDERK